MKSSTPFTNRLSKYTHVIEKGIAVLLLAAALIIGVRILAEIFPTLFNGDPIESLHELLAAVFSLIIVIEFVRMLISHSMESVIEVLIFALSRGMIVNHYEGLDLLIMVACIGILFVVRKYCLFHEDIEKAEECEK